MSDYTWVQEPNYFTNMQQESMPSDGRYIYNFGTQYCPTIRAYDTYSKLWKIGTAMSDIGIYNPSVVADGKLYLWSTDNKYLNIYDTVTDSLTKSSVLPSGAECRDATLASLHGEIYVIGKDPWNNQRVHIFNMESGAWKSGVQQPAGRPRCRAVACDGKIFTFAANGNDTSYLDIFDPVENIWMSGAPLPGRWYVRGIAKHDDAIYVMGNLYGDGSEYTQQLICYEAKTNTYSEPHELPVDTVYGCTVARGRLYIHGYTHDPYNDVALFSTQIGDDPGPVDPPEPGSVGSLARLGVTLSAGKTVQSSVSTNLADNAAYTFSTENPAVATVGADGLVRGIAPGATRLKAVKSDEDFAESMPVRVAEGGTVPGSDGNGQYFLFVEKDDGGKMHFHAREISECDC